MKLIVFLFNSILSNVIMFILQEIQEARKSFSKKDEENILSGRDKRLAEQVSSYNVSKKMKYIKI